MTAAGRLDLGWIPAALTALALAALLAIFAREMGNYRRDVGDSAWRDLDARAALVANRLEGALETADFPKVYATGAELAAAGIRLAVLSPQGGTVYDSQGRRTPVKTDARFLFSSGHPAGTGHVVVLGLDRTRVFAPFRRAWTGFALAALAGGCGVLLFFVVTYRQRVRIRELARLEKFRREFVADVSHEIKTPLTGILGAVDLLPEAPPRSPAETRLLGMIRGESTRLNALVQAILDLARLERDGETLDCADVDLAGLARDLVARRVDEARALGVRLSASGCEEAVVVRCDAALVERALDNLVGNALRHSQSDRVNVRLARSGRGARLAVEDCGVGIPLEHAARVFERFHRVDPARAAATGGAGLGLAIVRRIARLHGGDVAFEAVKPHGARFVLTLPGAAPRRGART